MGSCAAPSAKGDDKFITTDYLQQCHFMHAVLSNCTTRIVLPAPKEFSSESLPHNFNMAAVGVMKKGMSMSLFSSPGHIVVAGQSGGGKSVPVKEQIDRIIQKYKEPFDE